MCVYDLARYPLSMDEDGTGRNIGDATPRLVHKKARAPPGTRAEYASRRVMRTGIGRDGARRRRHCGSARLADLENPVVLILDSAVLDAGEGLAELLHHGADLIMTRREGDHGIALVDLAHGADDGGGAA